MSWALLENSLLFAALATLLALAAGLATALWLFACGRRVRLLDDRGRVALALPPFLVANCWLDLLGRAGGGQSWLAVNLYDLRSAAAVMSLMLWPVPCLRHDCLAASRAS
jgi:ABC-type Fe3+ transport system permease subunit